MEQITWAEVEAISAGINFRGAFSFIVSGIQFTRLIKCGQTLDIAACCVSTSCSIFPAVDVTFYLT